MQDKSENYLEFSERTEALAKARQLNLSDLPVLIGISPAMFYAYRTGKYRISEKAWRKLASAEAAAISGSPASTATETSHLLTDPHLAWGHYLSMEWLLDEALKTRRPAADPQAEEEFKAQLRTFAQKRERGRAALVRLRDTAERLAALVLEPGTRAAARLQLEDLTRQAEARLKDREPDERKRA